MPSAVPQRPVRMDDDLYEKICMIAKEEERSFNQQVVYVLKKYVDQWERDNNIDLGFRVDSLPTDDRY